MWKLPWRVPSQGELYESTVENLWNSRGESKTMDGERIYIVLFPGLYHHTVLNCLSIYKNGGARPGLFWNIYLGRHRYHTHDKMDQASPSFFFFCILQAIKNRAVGRAGSKARVHTPFCVILFHLKDAHVPFLSKWIVKSWQPRNLVSLPIHWNEKLRDLTP